MTSPTRKSPPPKSIARKIARSCASSIYRIEEAAGSENLKNVFNWRVLRWALIPLLILIVLSFTAYTIVVLAGEEPQLVDNKESIALLDVNAQNTYAKAIPKEEEYQRFNDSTLDEDLNTFQSVSDQGNDLEEKLNASKANAESDLMYSDGDTFLDKLLSSFRENLKMEEKESEEGLSAKEYTHVGLFGSPAIRIPNGHKYGEYQAVSAMSRFLDLSTTSLPVSPTLPSLPVKSKLSSTTQPPNNDTSSCFSPRLSMCRGILPWDLTTMPGVTGLKSASDFQDALAYFELVVQSGCSARAKQFLCSVLEPQCQPQGVPILPPCRKPCRAVAEECSDLILDKFDLSQIFNCDNYPDSEDSSECVNLAKGENGCLKNELMCEDGSCIPKRWQCDGLKDCPRGKDEENCAVCKKEEFMCKSKTRCIPVSWRCDGQPDCPDRSDEFNCQRPDYEKMSHSHASPCPDGELRCVDGRCITIQQICDGAPNCSDGADEVNCRAPGT